MKHLLLVHGTENHTLDAEFKDDIGHLLADKTTSFEIALMNSRNENLYRVIERIIDRGETTIRVTPLTFFSTHETKYEIPEIIDTFNHTHPWVKVTTAETLCHHPHIEQLIESAIQQATTAIDDQTIIALTGMGFDAFKHCDDELVDMAQRLSNRYRIYPFSINGEMQLSSLLPYAVRKSKTVIVLPTFVAHRSVHEQLTEKVNALGLAQHVEILPNVLHSKPLPMIILERLKQYETSRVYL